MKNEEIELSVVIPAFNEEEVIGSVLRDIKETLRKYDKRYEIIVVDDGSFDKTAEVAAAEGVKVVQQPYNIGNGAAVKAGVRNSKGKYICIIDADGQHKPEDILRLVEHVPRYDLVVGARNAESEGSVHRNLANRIYNWLASYLSGMQIDDLTSGFRLIKRELIRQIIPLMPNTFSTPTTTTLASIKAGYAVKFVPIQARKRVGKSKIKLLKDGSKFFLIIFKIITVYSPLKIFIPISFVSFLLGFFYMCYTIATEIHITNFSVLMISLSIIIFLMGFISEQITALRLDKMNLKDS